MSMPSILIHPKSQPDYTSIDPPENNQCQIFLIVHHPRTDQVLLNTNPCRGHLPCLVTHPRPMPFFFGSTIEFLPELRDLIDITSDITVLRCLWYKLYDKTRTGHSIFRSILVLESHSQFLHSPTTATEWLHPSQIIFPAAAVHEASHVINSFVQQTRTGILPPERPLFARRGWYQATVVWMKHQLRLKGYHPVQHVAQVSCSYRGTALRATLTDGTFVYLKCSHFVNEALVYEALLQLIPKYVTVPIAADPEKRIVLMKDCGTLISPFLFETSEMSTWAYELADIHRSTTGQENLLAEAGLKLLTYEVLAEYLDIIYSRGKELQLVDDQVIKTFEEYSDRIRRDCRTIVEAQIPATFVHGDLYFSNVYRMDGSESRHGITDFGESVVSQPLVDGIACQDRRGYTKNLMQLLEKHLTDVFNRLSEVKLLECGICASQLDSLWQAVRLCHEMDQVESPMPPAILHEFKSHLERLLIHYEGPSVVEGPEEALELARSLRKGRLMAHGGD